MIRPISASQSVAPAVTVGDHLEAWACRLDRRWVPIILMLGVIYVALIAPSVHRHLWFDELHTYYIAQASSVRQFVEEIRVLDLNPFLTFLLARASMSALGPTEVGTRLPVILGFFLGSIAMFIFMARRVGALWAAAGVGLLWYNQSFYYATEARPYGILLGFLGLMLVSWDYAADPTTGRRLRRWALGGVAAGAAGMLLSHGYAVFWIMPFWAAELIRQWRQRHIDWPLWAALILPMASCLTYIPLLQNAGQAVFEQSLQGSLGNAVWFYVRTFYPIAPLVIVGGIAAIGIAAWRRASAAGPRSDTVEATGMAAHDLTFLVFALLPPALLNIVTHYMHIAFYDRHAFLTRFTADLLILLFIAYECRANRLSGLAAAIIMLGFTLFLSTDRLKSFYAPPAAATSSAGKDFERIDPELPFVANSVLTYLEMDHYEKPEFLTRLYYLVDSESAIKYTHSNMTEGLPVMKQYFPIRANVASYSEFTSTHRHFLVWGVPGQQGWLLTKLNAEGAQVKEIGRFDSPYSDPELYEVRLDH
jgi:hypothetical protein